MRVGEQAKTVGSVSSLDRRRDRALDLYRGLLDDAHEAILILDLSGRLVYANPQSAICLGRSQGELCGREFSQILHGFSFGDLRRKCRGTKSQLEREELTLVGDGGSKKVVQLTARRVMNEDGVWQVRVILKDTTLEHSLRETCRRYFGQIASAQEAERRHIARELHDDAVQELSRVAFALEGLARRNFELSSKAVSCLEDQAKALRRTVERLRDFSHWLRPDILERLGLIPALEVLVDEANRRTQSRLSVVGVPVRLARAIELFAYRIVQEALSNALKHSRAERVIVTAEFKPPVLRLSIADNGTGFEVPGESTGFMLEHKLGIAGMRERASLIGGHLSVRSTLGEGTTVQLELPIENASRTQRENGERPAISDDVL
jgi:PAS domain S-box-containing protein